ncbi:DUF927 domain-containing protein [Deinococcus sp. YIM 77859]|uniref:DUF927 domain-containing protein n=1 Tax=Deinococcus sp. YIM 77859 TaxID=1540221 RepID=UPI00068AE2B4|nr:DUF927 domain-containing protein [Deinococcus sp. YIM 77859]
MSALGDALRHPANQPRPLVEWLAAQVNPGADLRGLADGGGVLCDFRPGLEEKNPSLSVSVGAQGTVFKRFGGDGFEGGAVAFAASALGISEGEAARLLIERAGLVDTPPTGEGTKGGRKARPAKKEGGKTRRVDPDAVREKLAAQGPLTPDALAHALRGWVPVTAGEDSPEHGELARRGLAPALASGLLRAYRFAGKIGPKGVPWKTYTLPRHILPGAVAFEVRGPDGQPWAVKVRNPGSKADLEAAKAARYVYLTQGGHSPAWCAPGYMADPTRPALIVEGELNAAAVCVMLEAAGQGHAYRVQGVASAGAWPHLHGLEAGRSVYIYADPDPEGDAAREAWAKVCASTGAQVRQVKARRGGIGVFSSPSALDLEQGEMFTPHDACDVLDPAKRPGVLTPKQYAAEKGRSLLEALERAHFWQPPAKEQADRDGPTLAGEDLPQWCKAGDVPTSKRTAYGLRGGKLCALTLKKEDGEEWVSVETLADFAAFITAEVIEEDGSGEARRVFQIEGTRPDGAPLFPPVVTVPTSEFSGMAWPVAKWGGVARLPAGQGKKDKARDAIQVLSNARGYPRRTVYQHTGWIQHPEHGPLYLTAGAVIGQAGGVDGVTVDLGGRLAAYALPDPAQKEDGTARPLEDVREAVRASLDLLSLAPDAVAVPLLGAAYRAALGPADFVVWTVGETGRHKTAFMGPVMSHYGARWGRKFLPDGWNSSANALESNAFRVKDALFVIDDFKPSGSAGDRARLEGTASRVIQGAADGAGRGTLTADRKTRAALYPRGLIATSAEDLPRGHSNRARLVMVEVRRPLIDSPAKSKAFFEAEEKGGAGVYALALAAFVQGVAARFEGVRVGSPAHVRRVRELSPYFRGQHGRTGDAAAELAYGWEVFLSFAVKVGAVKEGEALALWGRVTAALSETARGQSEHLTEADPVARALALLSGLLAQGRVYLEDLKTGGQPDADAAGLCGWQRVTHRGEHGEEESYRTRPGAVMVGYHVFEGGQDWGLFLPDGLHEALQRAVQGQAAGLLPDAAKLYGNMRDRLAPAGLMKCETEAGGRVRYTAKRKAPDGVRRHFVTLQLTRGTGGEFLGTLGTLGTHGEESTSSTAFGCVPNLNYFSDELGTLGTLRESDPSSSSPSAPAAPALPDADSPEDLEAWAVEL